MLSHKPTGQPAIKLTVLQAQAQDSGIAVIAVCINKMDSHTAFVCLCSRTVYNIVSSLNVGQTCPAGGNQTTGEEA